jgi:tetratricopeptide (TPR) repeat protein
MSDPKTPSPDELRAQLFDAASRQDATLLEELCIRHQAAILEHFTTWQKPPESVRRVQPLLQRYIDGLVAVARCFADRLSRPELMEALQGPPGSNPLLRWQQALDQARSAMEALNYADAEEILRRCLEEASGLQGSGVTLYLPVTYGLLGECLFQSGHAGDAVAPTAEALDLSQAAGDTEGERAYVGNLYEIHRYLGDAPAAAEQADRLADLLERDGDAAEAERYRKQAALVRKSEPANRVICNIDGRRLELTEALGTKLGGVQFAFERNRLTLRPAVVWSQQGHEFGARQQFDEALALFHRAAEADRFDPHCRYHAGLTLLCLERYAEAVASYEEVEALAPGWFHCRSDLWLAQQLAAGRFNHPVFLLYHLLEDGAVSPQEKLQLADRALQQVPGVAFIHRGRGRSLLALQQRSEAEEAYRRGLACAEEPDIRTRLLVDLATTVADVEERRRLLDEAIRLDGNLVAAAMATLLLAQDG